MLTNPLQSKEFGQVDWAGQSFIGRARPRSNQLEPALRWRFKRRLLSRRVQPPGNKADQGHLG